MNIRLFDPQGIKPAHYKSHYPELDKVKEFDDLRGKELIFVWYYANATSPIIDMEDDDKRVEEALKRSGFSPEPSQLERILNLQFDEKLELAIEKMKLFIPGARYLGWKALKSIFDQYQEIANKPASEFTKKSGTGENAITETDYRAYADVTAKVTAAMPVLIQKLEESFGITMYKEDAEEDEGFGIHAEWFKSNLDK